MPMTDYQRNHLADREFGRATGNSTPATYYIALSTTTPSVNGTGFTEPAGAGYARVPIQNNKTTGFGSAVNGVVQNINTHQFPDSTAPWGTITHWFISDSQVGGNPLYYGALAEQILVITNSRIFIDAGAVQFEVGNLPAL